MADDWLCTPLHNAAGAGHALVARELLEAGADLDARSANKSKTPLDLARDKDKHNVIPVINEYMSKKSRLRLNQAAFEQEKKDLRAKA